MNFIYRITCDGYPILDLRDEELMVSDPKVKVEVNTIGELSFTIYKNHPYFEKIKKKKSVIEVSDEIGVIFRGRATEYTKDFNNGKTIDGEGAMGFFNDSVVPSFNFPEAWLEDDEYITASESGNVVDFFLNWLISNHNSQTQPHQHFKKGVVTVSDPNNFITRESSEIQNTWETLKSKLFESALGGYLCIRYEEDGNYIDYLSEFTLTNTQDIEFGENLLDLTHTEDATETYSAIIPIGAEIEVEVAAEGSEVETVEEGEETEDTEEETEEETTTITKIVTLEDIPDGAITDDIYKITLENGLHALYSQSAVEEYGWIVAPVEETTWDDVTEANNLLSKGSEWLTLQGIRFSDTVEITAVDLHFTDEEIRSFRIYRKINVNSLPHWIENSFDLTKLDIDLLNPQNTKITVGETKLTLTDQNNKEYADNIEKIQDAIKDVAENRTEVTEVKKQMLIQKTEMINTFNEIILGALETYVETGNYEEFKKTVEAQLQILSNQISFNFTETTSQIEDVNGDLQETITKLEKHFDFSLKDGLIIKTGENQMQLKLNNNIISFEKNGVQFGWWDGIDFHTGNIVVTVNERAQFGSFAFVPRSDGSLAFLKVGDRFARSSKLGDAVLGTMVLGG